MSRSAVTKMRLQEEAVKLFGERGYHEVTVEDIARAAGVSHMTFFRHFPTKASVLTDDPYDPVIAQMIASTDPILPALERVRQGLLAAWAGVEEPGDEITRARFRILTESEELIAAAWSSNRRTEQMIVEALVSTGAFPLEARVAAGSVMGALMAALVDWGQDPDSGSLGDRIRTALEMIGRRGENGG